MSVVRVGNGYEGASSDDSFIHFWRTDDKGQWQKDGDVRRGEPFSTTVDKDKIESKLMPGATHAVFIVHRALGGTGSSPTEQVFAHDGSRWGSVASTNQDGSAIGIIQPSGGMDSSDMWNGASFTSDALKLGTFHTNRSNAEGFIIWRAWKPNGNGFTLTTTDDPSKNVTYTASSWSQFVSPSGKNFCDIEPTGVGCALSPAVRASHGGDNNVYLSSEGVTTLMGDGPIDTDGAADAWGQENDAPPPPMLNETYVLEHGNTIKSGAISCKSSTNGITCSNGVAGFTVNSKGLTMTGKRARKS